MLHHFLNIHNNLELQVKFNYEGLTLGNGAVSADKDRIDIKPYAPTFAETKLKNVKLFILMYLVFYKIQIFGLGSYLRMKQCSSFDYTSF